MGLTSDFLEITGDNGNVECRSVHLRWPVVHVYYPYQFETFRSDGMLHSTYYKARGFFLGYYGLLSHTLH